MADFGPGLKEEKEKGLHFESNQLKSEDLWIFEREEKKKTRLWEKVVLNYILKCTQVCLV